MLKSIIRLVAAAALAASGAAAAAQAADPVQPTAAPAAAADPVQPAASPQQSAAAPATRSEWFPEPREAEAAPAVPPQAEVAPPPTTTAETRSIPREDVFTAAEGVFGRGAEGLAGIIERIIGERGEPTAYISGREAGGAFVVGLRYGSGVMRHRIEGERQVYWTGPSLGFDFGADANKVFVLVYNLNDSQELFRRYPAAEGHAYMIGGFTASYLRRGDIVLVPVRLGVGMRLGVNAGYMRFSERNRWLPF